MLIYFCLLIPIIAVIFVAWKFSTKMAWWEYLLVLGIPTLAIFISKYTSVATQVMTPEIWNSYLVKATYYEPWNEYIHETCYETCRDEDGNTYDCNPYDCSYVKHHPAEWVATDNIGKNININQQYFSQLCIMWNNRSYEDMNRHYHTIDGNAYNTFKDTVFDHIVPRVTSHQYENRVRCSRSVFNFAEVDSEDVKAYKLFNYPPRVEFNYNPILGFYNPPASLRLQRYNALFGSWKQVHMMILVFKNQPVKAAIMQESYWKGGNKNEFILCIGTRDTAIDWAKVISWTEVDELKIRVEKEVMGMPLNMEQVVDYMAGQVKSKFQRKHFKDFSYISVEPTMTAVWITLAITLLVTVGVVIFSIKNDFDSTGKSIHQFRRRF